MSDIRPLLVSYEDKIGGAARATFRLHEGLRREGIDSKILCMRKSSDDSSVSVPWLYRSRPRRVIATQLELLPHRVYVAMGAKRAVWSTNLLPTLGAHELDEQPCNVVHFHWVGGGFVPISTISKIKKPVIWTLHDMWGFTGGCHYSEGCRNYLESCGKCPVLASSRPLDLSRVIWNAKKKHWSSMELVVVSPSHWLADCARRSSLFGSKRIEVIPNGIDTEIFRPRPKEVVRAQLGLSPDAKLILFGAMSSTSDPRKGYHLLQPALHLLAEQMGQNESLAKLEVVVVGATKAADDAISPIPTHYAGYINDDNKLAALYAAADLFVAPSTEENLANTVMEALSCGVPTVAFDIGGMPDMIEHKGNGYLATPFDINDLANGMAWILADKERHTALATRARAKVNEEFSLNLIARRHESLYRQVIEEARSKPN